MNVFAKIKEKYVNLPKAVKASIWFPNLLLYAEGYISYNDADFHIY